MKLYLISDTGSIPGRWSFLVKTVRVGLLILAAIAVSTPLRAEIDAPDAHWHSTATAETSTINWARIPGDANEAANEAAREVAQDVTPSAPGSVDQKSAESQKDAATERKKPVDDQESHERVLGLAPMFTVVNDASKARALTVDEKWKLFYRQTYDPFQFVTAAFSASISQAENQFPEYGQGMKGYAKRYGAGFADNSLGAFFGNFALPSLLHDDPRYFRKGSGPFMSRLLHAAGAAVITRRDDGTSRPNYSNVGGNLIGCAIGNLYYPKSDRGVETTLVRGFEVTAYGAIGGVFQEFWPDIQNKILKKHKPTDVK
jgi:hypothetical protein